MESFSGDTGEAAEDFSGRKRSKIKSMKSRLLSRTKQADTEDAAKLSQSAGDVTAGKGLGSDEDLAFSQDTMGSRAWSCESIFLADDPVDPEPARILSQENVHSKIKALQMKLQLQKMHLGPPPAVLPVRCPEEPSGRSEDDLLQSSSGEVITAQETLTQTTSQPSSGLFSAVLRPQTKSLPPTPSHPMSVPVPQSSSSSTVEAPLDFGAPAQLSTRLDTSAARHRMSIKPRNQRASTKKKPLAATSSSSPLPSLNSIDLPDSAKDQELVAVDNEMEDEAADVSPSHPPPKSSAVSLVSFDPEPKPLGQSATPPATVASQVLRAKPPMRSDTLTRGRPHSSFIESEPRDWVDFGKQHTFVDKKTALNKSAARETSPDRLHKASRRSSSAQLWPQGEAESTKGIKRPAPRTGSFKISLRTVKTQEEEARPRAVSFTGQTEEKSVKEEPAGSQVRGNRFAVGRIRPEGDPSRTPVPPQDKKDTLKTAEPAADTTPDTGAVEAEEMESSQELDEEAEEAKEVQEDEAKSAFGVRLRATSQSLKYQSQGSSSRHQRAPQLEDPGDRRRRQEVSNNVSRMPERLTASTSSVLKPADPAPSGISLAARPPPTDGPQAPLPDVLKVSSGLKETPAPPPEPQPAPQTSSSEVSWMSLAMEKTRSIQQLFSRFPLTGTPAPARTQAPASQPSETTVAAQSQQSPARVQAAVQAPAEAAKEEPAQTGRILTIKMSSVATPQKTMAASPVQSNNFRESQTKDEQSEPSTTVSHSPSRSVLQSNPWMAQSPLRSSSQAVTSSSAHANAAPSPAQSYVYSGQQQQQPSWTNRALQPVTSTQTAASPASAASTSDPPAERGEREDPSWSVRWAVRTGSVGERAAFLEKRAEWNPSASPKEVELKTSGDFPSPAKTCPPAEGRPGPKPAESIPTRVPEKPREDRWLRKTAGSHPSPSSSPTHPSVLRSAPEGGQPSWMELARRKSMAWSDKPTD
ncbi:CRACD-like protein isoform X2 [Cololabis saira]|nr:CRACD-like protein isoform X2 [Cololabis saira]XP_061580130.1 CRACD-like protein isoform X2 [Cololabis saira]